MFSDERKMRIARFFGGCAFLCGVIGLVAGLLGRRWRLSPTGWFTGGTLLAVLACLLLVYVYVEIRSRQRI